MSQPINIIFDGAPGPAAGRFVEVETDEGKSVNVGEWIDRKDGTWALRIAPVVPELHVSTCGHGSVLCAPCGYVPESWRPQ
jgi:hypothetical protein